MQDSNPGHLTPQPLPSTDPRGCSEMRGKREHARGVAGGTWELSMVWPLEQVRKESGHGEGTYSGTPCSILHTTERDGQAGESRHAGREELELWSLVT